MINGAGADLPPQIVETFLLHAGGSDLWRGVTVWRSSEELNSYRRSVETLVPAIPRLDSRPVPAPRVVHPRSGGGVTSRCA